LGLGEGLVDGGVWAGEQGEEGAGVGVGAGEGEVHFC
jgi:hypothetical protein